MIFLLNLIGRGNSTAVVCGMVNPMAEAVFPEGMPVMDGVEAARALRKLDGKYYREVPVIALTANTGTEQQREYAEADHLHWSVAGQTSQRTATPGFCQQVSLGNSNKVWVWCLQTG